MAPTASPTIPVSRSPKGDSRRYPRPFAPSKSRGEIGRRTGTGAGRSEQARRPSGSAGFTEPKPLLIPVGQSPYLGRLHGLLYQLGGALLHHFCAVGSPWRRFSASLAVLSEVWDTPYSP